MHAIRHRADDCRSVLVNHLTAHRRRINRLRKSRERQEKERSNECRRAKWLSPAPDEALVGARFRGHNRSRGFRWSRVCEVIEADPGRAFAFRTVPERSQTRNSQAWRSGASLSGTTTRVTHGSHR